MRACLTLSLLFFVIGSASAKDDYKLGPDSLKQPGVPEGKVTQMPAWKSDIFPGTVRDWWIYVPAQYNEKKPACVMIFQDGIWYQDPKGAFRAPAVFDNLIHKKEMPVTIGIFLNPGVVAGRVLAVAAADGETHAQAAQEVRARLPVFPDRGQIAQRQPQEAASQDGGVHRQRLPTRLAHRPGKETRPHLPPRRRSGSARQSTNRQRRSGTAGFRARFGPGMAAVMAHQRFIFRHQGLDQKLTGVEGGAGD